MNERRQFCQSLFWQIKNDSLCIRFTEHAKVGGFCHWMHARLSFGEFTQCKVRFVLPFQLNILHVSVITQAHGWLISHTDPTRPVRLGAEKEVDPEGRP